MEKSLPLFNWSLKKALDTESDSFIQARIRIIFTIILLSLLKALIVIVLGSVHEEWRQVGRAAFTLTVYMVLLKTLLYRPSRLKVLAHIMIIIGVLLVWTNIFIYAHKINLVTLQFVFMIALSSFYVLGSRQGIFYSISGMLPVVLLLVFKGSADMSMAISSQEFGSPGNEIIVVLNFATMLIAHYLFFEAFNVNIKEKEKLNQQLRLSVADANKLAATRADFLSTMSHELRTPLNSVVGIAELLIENKPQEHQKEDLKILQHSALDLLALINNVLDFNKMDSDKLSLEDTSFHLASFIYDICSVLKVKADNKRLAFVLNIDERLEDVYVVSDPTRLSQVIYNLIGNAIKFTENGSVTVKLDLVSKTATSAEIHFSVQDTGIGIPEQRHDTIFELFTQADSHIIRKYGGTGLGLAIVKKVLVMFDSTIQVESNPGKGSKFFFTIPFTITTDHVVHKLAETEVADLGHLKILVAEDDEINRLVLSKQLDNLGVKPLIVENGMEAYEAFQSWHFDVVFLDLHMPVAGGYETIKMIRELADSSKANVYAIAFTASVTEEQKIFEAGFNNFLYKPTNLNDLRTKLEKVVQHISMPVS